MLRICLYQYVFYRTIEFLENLPMHITACKDELVRVLKSTNVGLWNNHGAIFIVHLEVLVHMYKIIVYSHHI